MSGARCVGLVAGLVLVAGLASSSLACTPTSKAGSTNDAPSAVHDDTPAPRATAASASPRASADHVRIVVATQDSAALSVIRTERLKAKGDGRALVVYVSATWCEPCKKFKQELESGRLDERLGKVTLLAFDADRDVERLGSAGYSFKFVPFVALPGPDGRPIDAQEATGKGGQAWRELLGKLDAWQRDVAK